MDQNKPSHAADRLMASIELKRSPVCVGIDPVLEKLPAAIRPRNASAERCAAALAEYCRLVIAEVRPFVPCLKFQSACFERYGEHGVKALRELIGEARSSNDVQIILDAKRGDIGVTAEHYAAAAFTAEAPADWLTINSYLGEDGMTPFMLAGRGAFALVRTSNPGGDAIQNLQLSDGRPVSHAVAALVTRIGSTCVGARGFSSLGAVVGATKPDDAKALRQAMPQQVFLVPGYGAQGGGIDDVLPCFKTDGSGALVTASRSVIYAFEPDDPAWHKAVADAAAAFAEEVGRAVGMR